MTAPELLPCPFCGGEAMIGLKDQTVWCPDHHCAGWSVNRVSVAAWNTRATDSDAQIAAAVHGEREACNEGWNPRYVAYAMDCGRSPRDQMLHDQNMGPFVRWIDRCLALYRECCPEAFSSTGLRDGAAFDAWLYRFGVPPVPPDDDALLLQADTISARLKMGDKIQFGADYEVIDALAAAIRARKDGTG